MEPMTLREAARRASRSITTLRRYIRNQRLPADKRRGRFGPEYFVHEQDLIQAGFETAPPDATPPSGDTGSHAAVRALVDLRSEAVPLTLYQELQMKHEQLLVQYGMVRVGGLGVLELRADLESKQRDLDEAQSRAARLRQQYAEETARLRQLLRQAELELHGRGLEIAALQEKARALELLTHAGQPDEDLERQFGEIMAQTRRVERLAAPAANEPSGSRETTPDRDH